MRAKINKSLDYNKLLEQQEAGKLLKKQLSFPLLAEIKYDGNYVTVKVQNGEATFTTSGGLNYTHTDNGAECFANTLDGYYLAERIAGEGKLGDRVKCNLRGPKSAQTSTGHTYRVFDYLQLEEYERGYSERDYTYRHLDLYSADVSECCIVEPILVNDKEELYSYLREVVSAGYEGLMLYQPDFRWKDTKSRTTALCKLKSRRTADLLCIDTELGTGKYTGLIGSLILSDSSGRLVRVGSGLSDELRNADERYFIDKVIEIEYEQIIDTYIQPTFIGIRDDKAEQDID